MLRSVIRHRTHVDLVSDFPPCVIAPQLMICSNKDADQRTYKKSGQEIWTSIVQECRRNGERVEWK